jgi:glutathione S-transferase
MPVNTRGRNRLPVIDDAVQADIDRVCAIWSTAADGWLFGDFCAADVMFAPVAARFQTYAITPSRAAMPYYGALLAHPLVAEWFALGAAEPDVIAIFELPARA